MGCVVWCGLWGVGCCGTVWCRVRGVRCAVCSVFDVVKPWPSSRFERLPGGLGIMADDAMAAVYGQVVMRGLIALAPGWFV